MKWHGNTRSSVKWYGDEIKRDVQGVLAVKINGSAKEVLAMARRDCPKSDKGALAGSGRVVTFKKAGVVGAYIKFGGQGYMSKGIDTYYGPFVELGTPGTYIRSGAGIGGRRVAIPGKPFLRNALKVKGKRVLPKMNGALK